MSEHNDDPVSGASDRTDQGRMTLLGHDLRAAVSDIIGGLRLVDRSGLDESTRLQMERVRSAGENLARLLEEGLSMMLGEDDFAATHPANLQMERFLYDVEMRWSGRAREKGLTFRLARAGDVPPVLTLDRVALERVLSNLLSNAIKFTDTGAIKLDVRMAESGALLMSVTDQGPGFSAEALTRIFEYRGRPDGSRKPGQGLGMHISRHMAERLGGTICVENLGQRGARVTLELPPETWTIPARDRIVTLPDLGGKQVLVAEDNATNQMIIGRMLSKLGAEYRIAEDGTEALRCLERETFDLALVDIEMPVLNGIEVIRAIRADPRLSSSMPIVAITAYVLRANRDAIYAAGADAILAKPLAGIEGFGMTIADVLGRRARAPEERPAEAGANHAFDRAAFDRLIEVAGPQASRELLDRLCEDLRKVERGLVAGLADAGAAAIRAQTHVLIALAGAVGAVRLQALAQALNNAAHRGEQAAYAALGQEALAQLDRLIHFVTEEQVRRGEAA
ncbi:Aerobic respiration control sensor protein ArcB [Defluviimonas aquaemixtae]|uniref:histidine kinase n=1 Tax=Albidovulum aquaemixtae TaxID=1542388 RepID=A0A2R8B3E7_9RHOB|nr:ATP-binding protein [Defluviimonas aquaemixtae]SPH17128.1 Aerobic respiration control sensor protein ArcB [Defluviimonas aquaemixtae]